MSLMSRLLVPAIFLLLLFHAGYGLELCSLHSPPPEGFAADAARSISLRTHWHGIGWIFMFIYLVGRFQRSLSEFPV